MNEEIEIVKLMTQNMLKTNWYIKIAAVFDVVKLKPHSTGLLWDQLIADWGLNLVVYDNDVCLTRFLPFEWPILAYSFARKWVLLILRRQIRAWFCYGVLCTQQRSRASRIWTKPGGYETCFGKKVVKLMDMARVSGRHTLSNAKCWRLCIQCRSWC